MLHIENREQTDREQTEKAITEATLIVDGSSGGAGQQLGTDRLEGYPTQNQIFYMIVHITNFFAFGNQVSK